VETPRAEPATLDVAVVAARPRPGAIRRRGLLLANAPDHDAVLQHVLVVIAPLARRAGGGCAFEDQLSHGSANRARKYTTLRKTIAAMKI
jgi:hypothetical protein